MHSGGPLTAGPVGHWQKRRERGPIRVGEGKRGRKNAPLGNVGTSTGKSEKKEDSERVRKKTERWYHREKANEYCTEQPLMEGIGEKGIVESGRGEITRRLGGLPDGRCLVIFNP